MADTTPTLREAATKALEALESLQGGCTDSGDGTTEAITVWCPEVITALRAALAEQAADQAEPVAPYAWLQRGEFGGCTTERLFLVSEFPDMDRRAWIDSVTILPLYLAAQPAPARQEPLTESQVDDLIHRMHFDRSYKLYASDETCLRWYRLGLRDGERAHGIVAAPAEGGA